MQSQDSMELYFHVLKNRNEKCQWIELKEYTTKMGSFDYSSCLLPELWLSKC